MVLLFKERKIFLPGASFESVSPALHTSVLPTLSPRQTEREWLRLVITWVMRSVAYHHVEQGLNPRPTRCFYLDN